LNIKDSTLVFNAKDLLLKSGDFISLFNIDNIEDNLDLDNVNLELVHFSNSLTAKLETDENNDIFGIKILANPFYSSAREGGSGNYAQKQSDRLYYVNNSVGASKTKDKILGDSSNLGSNLKEMFGAFQSGVMTASRNLQNRFVNLFDEPNSAAISAGAIYSYSNGIETIGATLKIADILNIYGANTELRYQEGAANGQLIGVNMHPTFNVDDIVIGLNGGYQYAWYAEDKNAFGMDSDNKIETSSVNAGAKVGYVIDLAQNINLMPQARFNWQTISVKSIGDDLFYNDEQGRDSAAIADIGGTANISICIIDNCQNFSGYGFVGTDIMSNAITWTVGANAAVSLFPNFASINFSIGMTKDFKGVISNTAGANARIVF
jgi:hypothetical protein